MTELVEHFLSARQDHRLGVLEGFHSVKHALRFGGKLVRCVTSDRALLDQLIEDLALDIREELHRRIEVVTPREFAQLAPRPPRTAVIATAHRRVTNVEDVLSDTLSNAPIVLLEDPRNFANIGASIRVAAAANIAGVITTGTQDPWQPDCLRGSAGLHYALPVLRVEKLPHLNRPLVAIDPGGEPFSPGVIADGSVLAFGTERYGLSDELLERANLRISIPMRPGVSSLNLATAVSAILFSWRLNEHT